VGHGWDYNEKQGGIRMMKNRFKSPVVWAAVVAQVLAVLLLVGVIGEEMSDTITAVVVAILEIAVMVGLLNDPVDREPLAP